MARINENASKHAQMKEKNLRLLLEYFRNGVYSTYTIGKKIGLSTGGAKKLVDEMLDGGIIKLTRPIREHSMGRNPLSCTINNDYRGIVIVNYANKTVKLMGLRGKTLDEFPIIGANSDDNIRETAERIKQMLKKHPEVKLGAISIAYVGKFDDNYNNYYTGCFHDCTINLYEYYREQFGVRVKMLNDLNFSLLAQRRRGFITNEDKSALLLSVGRGVACAIMINDKLYTGATGLAGEIGHNRPMNGNGSFIIEKLMDWDNCRYVIEKRIAAGEFTLLEGEANLENTIKAYEKGDELVCSVVNATIPHIVTLLQNTTMFMDFGVIFLSGRMFDFGKEYFEKVRDGFYASDDYYAQVNDESIFNKTKLVLCPLLDGEINLGAFDAAQDMVFEDFVLSRIKKPSERE